MLPPKHLGPSRGRWEGPRLTDYLNRPLESSLSFQIPSEPLHEFGP